MFLPFCTLTAFNVFFVICRYLVYYVLSSFSIFKVVLVLQPILVAKYITQSSIYIREKALKSNTSFCLLSFLSAAVNY